MIVNANSVTIPLADESVHMAVTSPPYWGLRDYGLPPSEWPAVTYTPMAGLAPASVEPWRGCLGLEPTPEMFVAHLVAVFREVWRVLRDDGTVFLNLGDSYFSSAQHGVACGTRGIAPEDYQDHDCLSRNLCDVCRVVLRRKSHSDDLLAPMLVASLSDPSRVHMEALLSHAPTSDFPHRVSRMIRAIPGLLHSQDHDGEQLRAFRASMPDESSRLLLDECLLRANHGECLLCARSLDLDDRVCAHNAPGGLLRSGATIDSSQGKNDGAVLSERRSECKDKACDCYTACASIDLHGNTYIQPECTTDTQKGNLKPKDLVGIPWRVAFALQADGWWLRNDIIWSKTNPMPESVTDRCTKAHEYMFLLSKSERYFYDHEAVKEDSATPGDCRFERTDNTQTFGRNGGDSRKHTGNPTGPTRNRRTVWTISTRPYSMRGETSHFATFPPDLVAPPILAGTSQRGVCPECGAPWERVVRSNGKDVRRHSDGHGAHCPQSHHPGQTPHRVGGFESRSQTLGWRPTCDCSETVGKEQGWLPLQGTPIPAIVLDPFCGSGTVGEVCRETGRRFVGLDLSPSYLRTLALPRAENKQTRASVAEMPLFELSREGAQ